MPLGCTLYTYLNWDMSSGARIFPNVESGIEHKLIRPGTPELKRKFYNNQ